MDPTSETNLVNFREHLKSCNWFSPCSENYWHGFDVPDNPELYMEEKRKCMQARLARHMRLVNARRLRFGYDPRTEYTSGKESVAEEVVSEIIPKPGKKSLSGRKGGDSKKNNDVSENLELEIPQRIIKLSDVKLIIPDLGAKGKGTFGTHVNGFQFTSRCSSFRVQCLFKYIKSCFFQLANGSSPPLLHFHLDTYISIGKKKTKDILFHLMIAPGSDKVEKGKQKKHVDAGLLSIASHGDRNSDLRAFITNVRNKWTDMEAPDGRIRPFQELVEKDAIHGYLPSGRKAVCILTFCSIYVRVVTPLGLEPPFIVVNECDIEIVNLTELSNKMFSMTVVCRDLKVDSLVEISFPSKSLAAVKDWLQYFRVKYYVNQVKNWRSRVKGIAENFQTFLKDGGWDQFELEDSDTVRDYYNMASESDSSEVKWGEGCSDHGDSESCSSDAKRGEGCSDYGDSESCSSDPKWGEGCSDYGDSDSEEN